MKFLKQTMILLLVVTGGLSITSCGNSGKKAATESTTTETMTTEKAEKTVDKNGKEYTSAYVCPMHCKGSGSDKPGKCPVCNMDYVANDGKDHGHAGHNH